MAKKSGTSTSLTEFSPLSPDAEPQPFSFRNLFGMSRGKEGTPSDDSGENKKTVLCSEHVDSYPCPGSDTGKRDQNPNFGSTHSSNSFPDDSTAEQNKGMTNILKRVMNFMDKKNADLQNYRDSDFKQYWMPDSNCKECYECGDKFTTFRRRHHCRVCGQIFCRRCCNQGIPGNLIGYTGDLRVCSYCFKTVLSCVQSLDASPEISNDLQAFHANVQQKLFSIKSQPEKASTLQQNVNPPVRRKSSVMGFREEDIAKAKPTRVVSLADFCSNEEYNGNPSESEAKLQDSSFLRDLYTQLTHSASGITYEIHQHKLNSYVMCMTGSDVVDWLINHNRTASRSHAVKIGQALVDAKLLECTSSQNQQFVDGDVLYKPKKFSVPLIESQTSEIQESMEPLWVKEIQPTDAYTSEDCSTDETRQFIVSPEDPPPEPRRRISSSSSIFYLNLDLKESRVSVSKPYRYDMDQKSALTSSDDQTCQQNGREHSENLENLESKLYNEGMQETCAESVLKAFNATQPETSSSETAGLPQGWHGTKLREDNGEKATFEWLNSSYKNLEINLLRQLLSTEGLSLSWCDIILPIVHRVIDTVRPDVKNDADDMDIRQYVQFKKIPGGSKSECMIVSGVVFSKTVAHRKMAQNIVKPTLLLLSSSLAYHRVENKFSSIDPVLMQEYEYLKNVVSKITVYKPHILLVEKTVSRLAQEMLLDLGITVVLNIKPTVMERIARCTQATIVSTVDAHLARPQLGTCQNFKVKTYSIPGAKAKTLMFFDGCPANLGCTILLRGGSASELKKVKQIVQFMVYVAFNWQLERSFLMDEYVLPPTPVVEQPLDIDSDDSKKTDGPFHTIPNSDSEDVFKDPVISTDYVVDSNTVSNTTVLEGSENGKVTKSRTKSEEHNKKLEAKCVDDYSDPLHSYLRSENDTVLSDNNNLRVASFPQSNTFRKLLDDIILCCSINVREGLPFLETETGKNCELRKFFPSEIYWSEQFLKDDDTSLMPVTQMDYDDENVSSEIITSGNVEILPSHKFVSYKFTEEWNRSNYIQSMLADFRARGGTIKYLCPHERVAKEKRVMSEVTKDPTSKVPEDQTSAGLCWEKKVDALSPYNHQSIAVLFCSYSCTSNNAPNYCVNPWVVKMDFYGSNDITLGGFLERYCFRSSYMCPSSSCDTPMTEHVRKFVHNSGCVHILLHELSTSVQAAENSILMWSWCQICKQASPVVTMSQDTWSFSFAKYLELRFYASSYGRRGTNQLCTHSLHHDHYQYFANKQLVAIFEYTPIVVWEVALPSLVINVQDEATSVSSVVDQIKIIAVTGYGIYSNILEKLFALQEECSGTSCEDAVSNMIVLQKHETALFREKIEHVQLRLTSPTLESMQINVSQNIQGSDNKDICNFMWKISDQVTALKYHITEAVQVWNTRIQDFINRKKEEKPPSKTYQTSKSVESGASSTPGDSASESQTLEIPYLLDSESDGSKHQESDLSKASEYKMNESRDDEECNAPPSNSKEPKSLNKYGQMRRPKLEKLSWVDRSLSWESIPDNLQSLTDILNVKMVKAISEPLNLAHASKMCQIAESQQEEDRCSSSSSSSSYTYGVSPGIYAGLMVPEPPCSESYIVCHKEHGAQHRSVPPGTKGHERSKSEGAEMLTEQLRTSQEKNSEDSRKNDKKERTVRTLLSQLLSNTAVSPIQSPFSPSEHMFLQSTDKIPVIVYDDEPSSIIAYALSSSEYEQQLQELKLNISAAVNVVQRDSQTSSPIFKRRQAAKTTGDALSGPENLLIGNEESATDFMDMAICNSQETEKGGNKTGNKMSNFHIEIQFNDNCARFYCRVYFAEQFRKLRCLVFGGGEDRYVRSLSRCIRWIARGGKSGSTFCKTTDDRFILKQMSKLEVQSFSDLAPSYFQYINKACLEQKPTLLAKIVGVYRIGYKNTATNSAVKMDLLVMENLFYGCNISQKYDLKGSVRNRLVNTSGLPEDDIVLLDENLLKITCDCPLYLRPHSKTVLTSAITNDTQFLANQSVMDYSLLVGLDEERKQLVVGIIDYIRTFTWDKKVEMLVKSSGILGGHGKMPTVVSPELYRERFCEAMDGYFLWVPDRWTGLGKGVDC